MVLIVRRTLLYHSLNFSMMQYMQVIRTFFIKLTHDMLKDDDVKLLPKHMFMMLLNDMSLFRANYDEWKDYTKYRLVVRQ